jgi:F-type H+-transporting ATPase subunit a
MMPAALASEGAFTWLSLIPFLGTEEGHKYLPFAHSMLAVSVCLLAAWFARSAMLRAPKGREGLIPEANLKPRNFFELYVEAILNMCRGVLGQDAERFFPLIAGIFLYVFVSNLMGVLPGFVPPTDQLNTNLPISITVFLVYNISGIRRQGLGNYLKHFLGPVLALGPLMLLIEGVSHLVRPVSLAVRLYGNIFGDHLVLDIFLNELPNTLGLVLGYGIPVIFLGLGIFVSFIQAFVFSLLSVMYIALAIEHHDDH